MQDLHPSCHTRHCSNGLEHRHRAKHRISAVPRRAQKNLGRQSPGSDAPIPPPHCKQREELARAALLGNEAQLPAAGSPVCAMSLSPPRQPPRNGGFVPLKARNQHLHFPPAGEGGREGRRCPSPGTAPTPLQLPSLVLNKSAGQRRDLISHHSPSGHLFTPVPYSCAQHASVCPGVTTPEHFAL